MKARVDSLILRVTIRYIFPLLLIFAAFILLRGHDEPGGGFIAGLVASAAYALYSIACGSDQARRALGIETRLLIGLGLLVAVTAGMLAFLNSRPFLTGLWIDLPLPPPWNKVGTPLLFDLGVFLTVVGVTLTIVFALEEVK